MKVEYTHTEEIHNMNSPREVVPLVMDAVRPQSVLDVGCGTGTWLKAFAEHGVTNYLGIDSDHVDRSLLKIPPTSFLPQDLSKRFDINRKFDLVISLEVAEHLPEFTADTFVESLTSHGDAVLFSAAIPGQGGQHHINEQWPAYWQKKFEKHGFFFHDVIRPQIWNNENVEWWYRQNMFLITKKRPAQHQEAKALVHPILFQRTIGTNDQYNKSIQEGKQGLKVSTQIFLNALKYKIKSLLNII